MLTEDRAVRLHPRIVKRIAAVRRAEDRPAEMRDAAHRFAGHRDHLVFAHQPGESPLDAEDFPAPIDSREDGRANDRVETRRVAAAGRDGDSHARANRWRRDGPPTAERFRRARRGASISISRKSDDPRKTPRTAHRWTGSS